MFWGLDRTNMRRFFSSLRGNHFHFAIYCTLKTPPSLEGCCEALAGAGPGAIRGQLQPRHACYVPRCSHRVLGVRDSQRDATWHPIGGASLLYAAGNSSIKALRITAGIQTSILLCLCPLRRSPLVPVPLACAAPAARVPFNARGRPLFFHNRDVSFGLIFLTAYSMAASYPYVPSPQITASALSLR